MVPFVEWFRTDRGTPARPCDRPVASKFVASNLAARTFIAIASLATLFCATSLQAQQYLGDGTIIESSPPGTMQPPISGGEIVIGSSIPAAQIPGAPIPSGNGLLSQPSAYDGNVTITSSASQPYVAHRPSLGSSQPSNVILPSTQGTGAVSAQSNIQWVDDFQEGWKLSRDTNRPMVIFITSEHCRYCDHMKANTWKDNTLRSRLRDFIAIRLSPSKNAKTLERIDVPAYPSTVVALPEGKVVGHKVGYQPAAVVHGLLTKVKSLVRK